MQATRFPLARTLLAVSLLAVLPTPADARPAPVNTDGSCRAGDASFFRDQGLTMKLTTRLQFNKTLLRERIDATVSGGVATLSGGMPTQALIAAAVDIARQTEGIQCVNNMLRVGAPSAG
jgi:hypothetical protein